MLLDEIRLPGADVDNLGKFNNAMYIPLSSSLPFLSINVPITMFSLNLE